jgi:aminoglycoside 6'-N-acetyltransferase
MVITFRLLEKKDYALFASWLGQPHVAKWWREPATVEFVEKEYGPGDKKTDVYVVNGDGQPIGIIQSYRIEDYPEHFEKIPIPGAVGVDLLIGVPGLTGKGYGTQLLTNFIKLIREKYPEASCVLADPETTNLASIRAFEKAGFRKDKLISGEYGPEQLMIFPL